MRNNRGFTLVEVMFAFVIILVGTLALLQTVNMSLQYNFRNQQRDEVTRVAEDVMHAMRTQPFGSVFGVYTTIPSKLRFSNRSYTVRRRVFPLSASSEKYQVDVRWSFRNYSASHSIVSVRGGL